MQSFISYQKPHRFSGPDFVVRLPIEGVVVSESLNEITLVIPRELDEQERKSLDKFVADYVAP